MAESGVGAVGLGPGMGATVLFVGQGEPMDAALGVALSATGVRVERVDAAAVIEAASSVAPDLIVLMGDAATDGGRETLQRLSSHAAVALSSVAILAERASLDTRLDAFRHGAVAVIDRTASADETARRLFELLEELPTRSGESTGALGAASIEELAELLVKELRSGILSVEPMAGDGEPVRLVFGAGRPVADAVQHFVERLRPLVQAEPVRYELHEATALRLSELDGSAADGQGDVRIFKGLRVLLVDSQAHRVDVIAQELRARGATVSVTDTGGHGLPRARGLDPEVTILDARELEGNGFDFVRELRHDPRLRWAAMLFVHWDEIWNERTGAFSLPALAAKIAPLVEQDTILRDRAASAYSFDWRLEVTGPSRLIRAVAGCTDGTRHVSVRSGPTAVQLDLADGLVVGAYAVIDQETEGREGTRALAVLMGLGSGRVRVEKRSNPTHANVMLPVDEALSSAAVQLPAVVTSLPPPPLFAVEPVLESLEADESGAAVGDAGLDSKALVELAWGETGSDGGNSDSAQTRAVSPLDFDGEDTAVTAEPQPRLTPRRTGTDPQFGAAIPGGGSGPSAAEEELFAPPVERNTAAPPPGYHGTVDATAATTSYGANTVSDTPSTIPLDDASLQPFGLALPPMPPPPKGFGRRSSKPDGIAGGADRPPDAASSAHAPAMTPPPVTPIGLLRSERPGDPPGARPSAERTSFIDDLDQLLPPLDGGEDSWETGPTSVVPAPQARTSAAGGAVATDQDPQYRRRRGVFGATLHGHSAASPGSAQLTEQRGQASAGAGTSTQPSAPTGAAPRNPTSPAPTSTAPTSTGVAPPPPTSAGRSPRRPPWGKVVLLIGALAAGAVIAWGVSDYEKVAQRFGFAEAPPAAASDATPAVNPAAGPPLAAVPPPTEPPSVPAEPVAAPAEGQPGGVVGADPSAADPTAAEPPDGVGAAGVDPPAGGEPAEPANAGSSATEGLDTRGLVSAGDRALAQGDTAAAEAYFQAALERDPRENHAMAGLAEANLARRDAANAIEWARKAVERRPRRASYQLLLGDALALGGQTAAARQAWQRAAELDSDSPARARLERP